MKNSKGFLFGGFISFSLLIAGCSESAGVESLSPDDMEAYLQDNEEAFILTTNTEDEEERQEIIEMVDENVENMPVKEINSRDERVTDNEQGLEDIGIAGPSVHESLSYYKNGELEERTSVSEVDYEDEEEKAAEIQNFDRTFE
ncbi:hypothetical protein HUG15_21175 [Salicibibacter cibarius]|uniref:Lipoprotein n=1 Tax=Salicibibacter cibarius TaxID=2743000 RepID=A0A7T7CDC6_9BACI|nr:hypothetical protein [Salicibibacter cibarius]QQK77840.1 hypothetical protein HUG15_21175 [Salicibibacter cibarius]